MRKEPRPSNVRDVGDRLKLHRHQVRADGRDYQVVTLRPGTRARFSTNFYHQTWHVLSDPHGALLLARLLWGLSYQRQPGTVVIIDRRFITSNPFDAEQGEPIVLVPADLTHLPARTARYLSREITGTVSSTVRWHTWGLDLAVDQWRTRRANGFRWHSGGDESRTEIEQAGGLLSLRASSTSLRRWAVYVATMGDVVYEGMSYTELDGPRWELCRGDGEVQTFRDFHQRVSVAKVSRSEVLAAGNAPGAAEEIRPLVWSRNATVRNRRRPRGVKASV
ncbi:hypothetical protein ACIBG8_49185 [Nonomuraea sp. NPDC050556]|uniref:hypothetical protein n=1 Tax=Nonomuraea sp. NPDC050556 TaxID=3364369 RepID=UPI0037BAC8D0